MAEASARFGQYRARPFLGNLHPLADGVGLGRLLLDPFSMLVYSTRAEDYEAIKRLRDQGLSVSDAIERLVIERASQ